MKTIDEVLLQTHSDRNYNYVDVKRAMWIFADIQIRNRVVWLLPSNMRKIYDCLNSEYKPLKEISLLTGFESKSISSQLKQMQSKYTGLVEFYRCGKFYYWRRKSEFQ